MTEFSPSDVATYYRSRLPQLKQRGPEWRCPCPVHGGKRDSFAVDPKTGRAYCHSECAQGWDILSLERELLGTGFPGARAAVFDLIGRYEEPKPRIVAEYPYTDPGGKLLYQVVRYEPKSFRQRRPDGRGGWIWNLKGVTPVPYRLPEVFGAETVYIVEGERDVETLEKWDLVATCNSGGAGKWRFEFGAYFEGKHVVILPDQDEPGRKHAIEDVAVSVLGKAASVRIIDLPAKDVTAWVEAGGDLLRLAQFETDAEPAGSISELRVLTTPPEPPSGGVPPKKPTDAVETSYGPGNGTPDAEQDLIAAILADGELYGEAAAKLNPEDFESEAHRKIFNLMAAVKDSGKPVEPIAVHLEAIKEQSFRRQLLDLGESIAAQVKEPSNPVGDVATMARERLVALNATPGASPATVHDAIEEHGMTLLDPSQQSRGILTPWERYNRWAQGLHPGELTIIAARPAMGKTALALNMAARFASDGHKCAFFSLEMSSVSLLTRLLISQSRADATRHKRGELTEAERRHVSAALTSIRGWPLLLDDKADTSVPEITAKCRAIPDLRVVFVDYLQLLATTGRRQDSRATLVGEISRGLKVLARELNISVVALSQLNRRAEEHGGRKPQLSDLRDSGSIEQDADVVVTIFRESEYKREREDLKHIAEVEIVKNRNGPTGGWKLSWLPHYMSFGDLEEERNEAALQ